MGLKKYSEFEVVNEGVLAPMDFHGVFDAIIEHVNEIETVEDLNKYIGNDVIEFMNYDTFFTYLKTDQEKKVAPPKNMDILNGVQFAIYNKHNNKINIVVLPRFFSKLKEGLRSTSETFQLLMEIIRHESVHLQQSARSDKAYSLERSPAGNAKKYFSHHSEQMAYALSFVDNMKQRGYTKAKMLDAIKNKQDTRIWIQKVYSDVLDDKQFKRFMRYVYDYINQVEE